MARFFVALSFSLAAGLVLSCETEPGGSGGEPETPQVCKDYCDVDVSCDQVDRQECEDGCTIDYQSAAATGGFCPQSFQGLLVCLAGLDCDQYDDFYNPEDPEDYPCRDEYNGFEIDC